MSPDNENTYENLLEKIISVPQALNEEYRDVSWLSESNKVGVTKSANGGLEILIRSKELSPKDRYLRRSLTYVSMYGESNKINVNRIVLPALPHFLHICAFICTELFRNGIEDDAVLAFAKTEPIISLAVETGSISNSAFIGLLGELLMLDALLSASEPQIHQRVLNAWQGWHRSKRDFSLPSKGVEVKTTLQPNSYHRMQGIHQVDFLPEQPNEELENKLYLVSIGLQQVDESVKKYSLPSTVDSVISRLKSSGNDSAVTSFLKHLSEYGSESGFQYDHSDRAKSIFGEYQYSVTFCRSYDLADESIKVLRYKNVEDLIHMDPESIRFNVKLPQSINSLNPINGLKKVALSLLESELQQSLGAPGSYRLNWFKDPRSKET